MGLANSVNIFDKISVSKGGGSFLLEVLSVLLVKSKTNPIKQVLLDIRRLKEIFAGVFGRSLEQPSIHRDDWLPTGLSRPFSWYTHLPYLALLGGGAQHHQAGSGTRKVETAKLCQYVSYYGTISIL